MVLELLYLVESISFYCLIIWTLHLLCLVSLQKTQNTAKELSQITNGTCLGYACDVRNYNDVASVVNETIKQFNRIDIVICGMRDFFMKIIHYWTTSIGAAGNFLAPISNMSPNAFKTVIDIDLVSGFILWILIIFLIRIFRLVHTIQCNYSLLS